MNHPEAIAAREEDRPINYAAIYPPETDLIRVSKRGAQISLVKRTDGYRRYSVIVPKEERHYADPCTPPFDRSISKRSFDALLRMWKRQLHEWDDAPLPPDVELPPESYVDPDVLRCVCALCAEGEVSSTRFSARHSPATLKAAAPA